MKQFILLPFLLILVSTSFISTAQDITNNKFGKGVAIVAKDSSFSIHFGARIQTLYQGQLNLNSNEYHDRFLTRRARLKFDGFAYSPRLTYKIELGLSNSDISGGDIPQSDNAARIILDAVLKYNFYRNWSIWFGQTKLPGNIERVISSQQLQFVDRSNLNSKFNIDRDAGIQLRYDGKMVRLIGSISTGEGRDIVTDNSGGYDYTLRGEWLPFGSFAGHGEYSGSDLKREETPKLMLAATFDYNDRAAREMGQLGDFMAANRSLRTWFIDSHFKYHGFSSLIEYADKKAPGGPVILDDNGLFADAFYTGRAFNGQAGYLFKNNFELAGRYTIVSPEKETGRNENTQYTLGASRYIVGHNLKVQSDITLIREVNKDDILLYRFQVELAF